MGKGGGGGGGDLGKSIDYLLIFVSEWMNGDWCVHLSVSVRWLLFDRQ